MSIPLALAVPYDNLLDIVSPMSIRDPLDLSFTSHKPPEDHAYTPLIRNPRVSAESSAAFEVDLVYLHRNLLVLAQQQLNEGYAQAAVLTAQTASEVLVQAALRTLLRRHGLRDQEDAILGVIAELNLQPNNRPLRKLYKALSGDEDLENQPWFKKDVLAHVERRNLVAHRGEAVENGDGQHSIDTVLRLVEHIELVVARPAGDEVVVAESG